MVKFMSCLSAALAFLVSSAGRTAVIYALDTDLSHSTEWIVRESPNFVFISEQQLQDDIPELAKDCEQAYSTLSPLLQWRFREKVTVLLSDRSDYHNGWATALPRPTLAVIAAPPRSGSFLHAPGDWQRRTIYHELIHLLQTDASYGFISRCNRVFGRVIPDLMDPLSLLTALACLPPGNAAPSWFLEGTAVWAETSFVGPGRGRNSDVDAVFRTAVDQNRLLRSNRWHLRNPDWPFGNAPYLYGLKAIETSSWLPRKGWDPEQPGRLAHAVASAPVAGFFNSQALLTQSRDFETITRDCWENEVAFQEQRIQTLRTQPLTETPRWSELKSQVRCPVWTRDGDIWASVEFDDRKSRLAMVDRQSGTMTRTGPRITPGWTVTAADYQSGEIYFTRLDGVAGNEWRSRLYRFNPNTGAVGRMPIPDRIIDIGASMNGTIAVVRRLSSGDRLEIYQWDSPGRTKLGRTAIVQTTQGDDTLSCPVFNRDGNTLFYILTGLGGSRLIRWSNTGDREPLDVWSTQHGIAGLDLQGGSIPVVITDLNGVFNMFRIDPDTTEPIALTHTFGGIHDARFSPDGKEVAAVSMDADGWFLTIIDSNSLRSPDDELPVTLTSPWSLPGIPVPKRVAPVALSPVTVYEPLFNLEFDYWTPWLNASVGYLAGGAAARWSDRSMTHRFLIYGGLENLQDEAIGAVQWEYRKTRPQWSAYLARQAPVYNGLMQDRQGRWFDYEETLWAATVSAAWEWRTIDCQAQVETGWQYNHRTSSDEALWRGAVEQDLFDRDPLVRGGESSLWMVAELHTATAYRRSLSLEDGWYVSLSGDWANRVLGSDVDRYRIRSDVAAWIPVPGLKHHVMKITAAYATSHGDRIAQGAFTVSGYDDLGPGNPPGLQSAMILRGYPANVLAGERAAAMGVSFRFPVVQRFRSFSSRSIAYATQVTGEFFWDTAAAWDPGGYRDWYRSYGFETNIGSIWFSSIDLAPGIGVCWLPDYRAKNSDDSDEKGDWAAYFSLKTSVQF